MRNKRKNNLVNCKFNFQDKQFKKLNNKAEVNFLDLEEGIQTSKQASGITLIALVVTIVVLLILAGVSISTVLGNNGIIPRANEAKFKTDLASIQEEFHLYVMDKVAENGEFSPGSLNASTDLLTYNTQPENEKGTGNINNVLKSSIAQKYIQNKNFSIIKGDLIYSSQNQKELEWAREVGLVINPYNIDENGVLLSSNTNLMLVDEATGTLVIPEMVTAIGDGTFGLVKGVKRIVIPSTVREIKQNAFISCENIEEVVFETKMENGIEIGTEIIGNNAFRSCRKLKTILLPNTIKKIGSTAFGECSSLSNVVLSNNINEIPGQMFLGCAKLTRVVIPNSVTSIQGEAFAWCHSLETINIPEKLTSLVSGCFTDCKKLNNIEIDSKNNSFTISENILFNKTKTEIIFILPNAIHDGQKTFTVPNDVTTLRKGLLSQYTEINKIVLPASVNRIIDFGFFTDSIIDVEIDENNNTYMSDGSAIYSKDKRILYMYYKRLDNIQVDENVTQIENRAFVRSNVKSLSIGKNVSEIKFNWDWNTAGKNMKAVNIDSENKKYTVEGQGIYIKDDKGNLNTLVAVFGSITKFEVPNGVKEIGEYVWYNNTTLTEISLPDSVKTIGTQAFAYTAISSITIPNSVSSIASPAFTGCNELLDLKIDNKKGSIPNEPWGCPRGAKVITWLR